ncbi:MAG: superoxide dismutase [Nanoarchaeota archaeon]|nr:superoxide dismutase [Nanoarchaeota archaeon]
MFKIKPLPYEHNSLEPFIDEETMRFHHDGHHKTYADKLNDALENYPELTTKSAEELLRNLDDLPEEIRTNVRNFGGGFANHNFLWDILKKDVRFDGEIAKEIVLKFGSYEKFKEEFSANANKLFGSGYVWLILNTDGRIEITSTSNQDSPLSVSKTPLLTIDMWEHAYYLKHKNKKADYINDYFNVINWEKVDGIYREVVNK